jgi:LysR family cyn operon transcriptional activator
VIPEIVGQFSAAHSGIRVTCSELAVEDIEAGLESGRLDLGISFLPPARKQLEGEKLFTEELFAILPAKHPLANRQQLRVRDLDSQPLVLLSPRYCTRQLVDRAFSEAGVRPQVHVEMNSVDSILSTVRQGKLATLLPLVALCQRDRGLRAIPLIEPTPKRNIGLLWLKGASPRAAAKAFGEMTEKVLAARRMGTKSRLRDSSES